MKTACFSALLLACLGLGSAWGVEPKNVITNGGFEEGLTDWKPDPKHVLLTDGQSAHSGKACLMGEVTGPKQALSLWRSVPVKAACRYDFQIAVKATKQAKLVLWAVLPGESDRKSLASWDKLKPQWQMCTTPITIKQDGVLQLQIVAPSSHNGPAGRMWIDDVSLMESPVPPSLNVTQDQGFNDEPTLARADDESLYLAWTSFRDGNDTVQLARLQPQEKGFKQLGQWQVAGGKGVFVLGPKIVSTGDRAMLLYASEQNRVWDLYVAPCGPEGPERPLRVTDDPAADINPTAACHNGTLWMAWESNRDGLHEVYAASLRDGKITPPERISQPDTSAYNPSLVVMPNGRVCVAWHSFRDDNYDIFLRRRDADGAWDKPVRLTRAPTIDRHAVLGVRGDELWLVYENAEVLRYHMGATNTRRLVVCKVDGDRLLALPAYRESPLWTRSEAPAIAFDTTGRLHLAYLRPRARLGWEVCLTCYDGNRWERPTTIFADKGLDRKPGLAVAGSQAFLAVQVDDMAGGFKVAEKAAPAQKSNVLLASAPLSDASRAATLRVEPWIESDAQFEAAAIHRERGEHLATPSIGYQGKKLKLFFGDLHHHSDISVCNRCGDQSVEEGYQHMRDICRLDFACSTDHCYNINPYLWTYMGKLARVNDDRDRFLTFLAEEWTSSFEEYSEEHPYGFYGHRNLILADTYFPRWWSAGNRQTPAQVWEELRKMNADFIHIPHQLADTGNVPTDWKQVDETAQPVAEIFQTRGSYEHHGTVRQAGRTTPPGYFIHDAWARGIVIGVIAAPDHGGGYGKACVYSPDLSRKAILQALRQRRCYGTTAAKIFLDVRVNDHLMGEKVAAAPAGPVTVKISTICPVNIDRVEVCCNNRFIFRKDPEGKQCDVTFVDRDPPKGRAYYYVRVIQKDEEIAWSSPVWFGTK